MTGRAIYTVKKKQEKSCTPNDSIELNKGKKGRTPIEKKTKQSDNGPLVNPPGSRKKFAKKDEQDEWLTLMESVVRLARPHTGVYGSDMYPLFKKLGQWYENAKDFAELDAAYYKLTRELGKLYDATYTECSAADPPNIKEDDHWLIVRVYKFLRFDWL